MSKFTGSYLILLLSICFSSLSFADCKYENQVRAEDITIGVVLNWTTFEETNNSMFIIEKSLDGLGFKNIGAVKGAGNCKAPKDYSFMDVSSHNNSKVYYRLRQIDFNGSFHFSKIITLNPSNDNSFLITGITSVEVIDQFHVAIQSTKTSKLKYTVKDWRGHVVKTAQKKISEGENNLSVDLTSLKEAIYRLELIIGEEKEILTFKKTNGISEKDLENVATRRK